MGTPRGMRGAGDSSEVGYDVIRSGSKTSQILGTTVTYNKKTSQKREYCHEQKTIQKTNICKMKSVIKTIHRYKI